MTPEGLIERPTLAALLALCVAADAWAGRRFGRGFTLEQQGARISVSLFDRAIRVREFHATTDAEAFDGWTIQAVITRIDSLT